MAQHIPIASFKQKAMIKIGESIGEHSFTGSLRYEEITDEDMKENHLDRVFTTVRTIPKGIIAGDNKGLFEVHTQPQVRGRRVTNIYLVA